MSNNSLNNNNISKDLTSQNHSTEPSINILSKLNSIANENFHQIIPPIVCEICYKASNLIICAICKNGFHKKCLDTVFLPEPFICFHCQKQFTEEEITSILNNPYNQSHIQRKGILDTRKIYKDFEQNKKIKKKLNTFNPTKKIELNEDNEKDNNNCNNNIINHNLKEKNKDKNNDNSSDNNINLNKKKNNKKINDINLIENMNGFNCDENYEKSEHKSIKKDTKNKIKIENDKNGGEGGGGENDIYESSIMSKSQEITLDKSNLKNKKRKKEKDNNSIIKNKSHSNHRNSPPSNNNNNNKNTSINNNDIKLNKDKNNKEEFSQSLLTKKNTKKKQNDNKNEKEQNILLSLTHTDPQYKRRKIKIGSSRQFNMYEFNDKYENKINFEEEEYERNDLVQVWSVKKKPFVRRRIK